MSLPGFTAELSFCNAINMYRTKMEAGEKLGARRLAIPQFYPIPQGWGGSKVVTICTSNWCHHMICDDSGVCRSLSYDRM